MAGAPRADLDWNAIDKWLESGCSGSEIAAFIGVNKATIYDRCIMDKEMPFSQYSQMKRAKGDGILRDHQFKKAIGQTESGDNTLLIWLGKTRLKQKEPEKEATSNSNFTIKIGNDLGSGINISATPIPNADDKGSE